MTTEILTISLMDRVLAHPNPKYGVVVGVFTLKTREMRRPLPMAVIFRDRVFRIYDMERECLAGINAPTIAEVIAFARKAWAHCTLSAIELYPQVIRSLIGITVCELGKRECITELGPVQETSTAYATGVDFDIHGASPVLWLNLRINQENDPEGLKCAEALAPFGLVPSGTEDGYTTFSIPKPG